MAPAKRARMESHIVRRMADGSEVIDSTVYAEDDDDESECPLREEDNTDQTLFAKVLDDHAETTQECWGCKYRFDQVHRNGRFPGMDKVRAAFSDNLGSTSVLELSRIIGKTHAKEIVEKLLEQGERRVLTWVPHDIAIHLEHHMDDPIFKRMLDSSRLHTLGNSLLGTLYVKGTNGPSVTRDPKAIMAYIAVLNAKTKLDLLGRRGKKV